MYSIIRTAVLFVCGAGLLQACGDDSSPSPVPGPTLSTVMPSTGTVGTELRIVGMEFRPGAQAFIGDIAVESLQQLSSVELVGFVPAGVAVDLALDVEVRNSDGTVAMLAQSFTAVAPTLTLVNGASRPSGSVGSVVVIEGTAFGDVLGSGEVLFSDGLGGTVPGAIVSAADWLNTAIVTSVPNGAADGPISVVTATGTSAALPFDVTTSTFDATAVAWSSTQSLPIGLSRHEAVSVRVEAAGGASTRFAHVLGGASNDGVPLAEVFFAAIQPDGSFGLWSATTPLPAPRASHAVAAATPSNAKLSGRGELYVLGGLDGIDGDPVSSVYRASMNEDGTLGSWTETEPLPEPLHSLGVVVHRGAVYVAGGATTGNVPVASVYRARIGVDGSLGAWDSLPALPSARAHHGVGMFGEFLYAVGGETAAVHPDDRTLSDETMLSEVAYVAIDPTTGDFSTELWTVNASSLPENRSKHSVLVAGSNLFVTSGLYDGSIVGSFESVFAPINADGSVAAFSDASGPSRLLTLGGANLFNQAALVYLDADEVAHVVVIGGDNVNLPGSKRRTVLTY